MRHLSVTIPDSLYNSFIDFFKHVPEVIINEETEDGIPEWHKKIVLDRINKENINTGVEWKEVRKTLKFKIK